MKTSKGRVLMICGISLLIAAAGLFIFNMLDAARAGVESDRIFEILDAQIEALNNNYSGQSHNDKLENAEYLSDITVDDATAVPEIVIDNNKYIGILEIPGFDLSLPIQSDWNEGNLRVSPCRYSGNAISGDLVICGHNYITHFGVLSSVVKGDTIVFTDTLGTQYQYKVNLTQTVNPTSISEMIISDGEWDMTLFTCTFDGLARFAVRCTLVDQ